MANRVESASDITLVVSRGGEQAYPGYRKTIKEIKSGDTDRPRDDARDEDGPQTQFLQVPISRLETTKEVEINEIREGSLKANGYSINSISYSGTMMFKGSKVTKQVPDGEDTGDNNPTTFDIESLLYNDAGVPKPVSITIQHDIDTDQDPEVYEEVLVTSDSYDVRNGEATETAFDFVAMDKRGDQPGN